MDDGGFQRHVFVTAPTAFRKAPARLLMRVERVAVVALLNRRRHQAFYRSLWHLTKWAA